MKETASINSVQSSEKFYHLWITLQLGERGEEGVRTYEEGGPQRKGGAYYKKEKETDPERGIE